jgi:hypothetical protein
MACFHPSLVEGWQQAIQDWTKLYITTNLVFDAQKRYMDTARKPDGMDIAMFRKALVLDARLHATAHAVGCVRRR